MADKPAAGLPAQPYGKGTAFCAKWQCCVLKISGCSKKCYKNVDGMFGKRVTPLTPKFVNGFINTLFVGGILTPCCVPFAHCRGQGSKALQMLLCRADFRVSDF